MLYIHVWLDMIHKLELRNTLILGTTWGKPLTQATWKHKAFHLQRIF